MILRMWRAQSTVEKADEYIRHADTKVFPTLRAIEGHRGAYLLRHTLGDTVELVVLTLWNLPHHGCDNFGNESSCNL